MKKNVLKVVTVIAIGISLTACKKKDDANTAASLAGTAQITGIVRAETNTPNAGLEIKSGAVILAKYNQGDLVLNPEFGVTYPNVVISATTNGDGVYSFTIPTNGRPVAVTILPQTFTQGLITAVNPTVQNAPTPYTANPINLPVNEKEAKIQDITYN